MCYALDGRQVPVGLVILCPAGKVSGDAKLGAENNAKKTDGKVQNAIGGMKYAVRDATDKV